MIKYVASDLDETLLYDNNLLIENKNVINLLRNNGIDFFVAI
jgi:hydroxymethylpyrimidine pyrophosphatase-like HAD family hydrolase